MTVELITGYAGAAHISSADDGWRNAGTYGPGCYVLDTGTRLAANVVSNNLVTIGTGDVIMQGRHVRVSETESVQIDNGAQGVTRTDLIVIHYSRNLTTQVETAAIEVIKGEAGGAVPSVPSGDILENAADAYMPLYTVPLSGITIGTPTSRMGAVMKPMNEISAAFGSGDYMSVAGGGTGAGSAAGARTNLSAAASRSLTVSYLSAAQSENPGTQTADIVVLYLTAAETTFDGNASTTATASLPSSMTGDYRIVAASPAHGTGKPASLLFEEMTYGARNAYIRYYNNGSTARTYAPLIMATCVNISRFLRTS